MGSTSAPGGFKAARGDAEACRAFYLWHLVLVAYAVVKGLLGMDGNPLGAVCEAVIVWHYWTNLKALETEAAAAVTVGTSTAVMVPM